MEEEGDYCGFGNASFCEIMVNRLQGAFTGVCSAQHVPSYLTNADKFKEKGVDSIVCVAVNDPYVMNGWEKKLQVKEAISSLFIGLYFS